MEHWFSKDSSLSYALITDASRESFVSVSVCQCVSVTVEQRRHGTVPQNGHGCNTRTTFDTKPEHLKLFIKQQQALSWSLRYYCNWILVFPVFRNGPRDFLIAFLPRVWPCERMSPLPIKWLSGWAYRGSCRGCQLTCGVTPRMATSPWVVGLCVTVTPLMSSTPNTHAQNNHVLCTCSSLPLWLFGGTERPVWIHTIRVSGAWQGLENKGKRNNKKG